MKEPHTKKSIIILHGEGSAKTYNQLCTGHNQRTNN